MASKLLESSEYQLECLQLCARSVIAHPVTINRFGLFGLDSFTDVQVRRRVEVCIGFDEETCGAARSHAMGGIRISPPRLKRRPQK
jgi:hypothetical protein